jgi:hypothetical protein
MDERRNLNIKVSHEGGEDSDVDDNAEDIDEKEVFKNVSDMEDFLISCRDGLPFRALATKLQAFLMPATLAPLTRVLMTVPGEQIWFSDRDDNSFPNRLKSIIENLTEDDWNWWPLRPRMRSLQTDQVRVHWICVRAILSFLSE